MNNRCDMCGGPLLGDGTETDDGQTTHAVCGLRGHADIDMNPESKRRMREMARHGALTPRMLRPYLPKSIDPAELSDEQIRRMLR